MLIYSQWSPGNAATGRICQDVTAESCRSAAAGVRVTTDRCCDGRQVDASSHQAPGLRRLGKPGDILEEVPAHAACLRWDDVDTFHHLWDSETLRELGRSTCATWDMSCGTSVLMRQQPTSSTSSKQGLVHNSKLNTLRQSCMYYRFPQPRVDL